jgi:hypothetical protein
LNRATDRGNGRDKQGDIEGLERGIEGAIPVGREIEGIEVERD